MATEFDRLSAALAGRYRVARELGRGGMATVYLAEDLKHHRRVAIKVLSPELASVLGPDRFLREIEIAAGLTHPHIVPLYDSGEAGGLLHYVMPFVDGESLRDRLRREKQLPLHEAVEITRAVADALSYAHSLGIVHRDIKPENIMFEAGHAVVTDFGIARAITEARGEQLTETGIAVGTPAYMSPEQAAGACDVDARSDIYALGCVLYELLAGQPPFTGPNAQAVLARHSLDPVPRLRSVRQTVPDALEAVVLRALAKVPADRFGTASEFALALEESARRPEIGGLLRSVRRRWAFALAAATTVVVVGVGGWWALPRSRADGGRIESLAVLPLKNLMGEPEQDYFVEGMHEALIAELSRMSALRVISRTSTLRYRDTEKPLPQVARELTVDGVIEGSVLREGDRVRITVQLIHGRSDRHVWAQSFDRELRGILALHSDVAAAIAERVRVTLTPQERSHLLSARAVKPEAHEAYLRGRYHWNKRTEASLEMALAYFQQATNADSTYALAYVGLAETYVLLAGFGHLGPQEATRQARDAALKALAIDDKLGEAYIVLAQAKWRPGWDWSADDDFRRGLALSPNYATGHQWYGGYLMAVGRYRDGIEQLKRAVSLDPLSLVINADLAAEGYYSAREYEQAVTQLQTVLELDQHFPYARLHLCQSYVQLAEYRKAIAECEEAAELLARSSLALGSLGHAYAMGGRRDAARALIQQLEERAKHFYVPPYDVAIIYTGLGLHDEALAWLDKAFAERSIRTEWMKVDPKLDPLRSDSRFQDLLRRMNFPD